MGIYDDSGFGGLGTTLSNLSSNPLILAGLQMLGNNTPQIGAIPNTMAGVPTTMMAAMDRQRKAQADARDQQEKQRQQDALTQALVYGGTPEAEARKYAPSLPAIQLYQDAQTRQRKDKEFQEYTGGGTPVQQQAPAQPAPYTPAPQSQQQQQAPAPATATQPDNAMQQALANASSKFDAFGQSSLGKTVAQVAAQSGNQTTAANFVNAARNQGMSPESQITGQILSNPATAMPLAKSLGIGADLPDGQWQQAHADAFQVSKARQAARAAEQQTQSAQEGGPVIPFTQTGPSPAVVPQQQQAPAQPAPQQQAPAPAPVQAPPQQAPEPNATERAVVLREQKRVAELQTKIAREERYLGSDDPRISKPAAERIQAYRRELEQKPQFTTIGKGVYGEEIKGFVHPDGTVTPYEPPGHKEQAAAMSEPLPGNTVEERLQSIPAETRPTVKAMLEGRQAPPSSFAMKTEYWQRLINMANRVDPEFDQTKWSSRVATRKDFDSGKTAQNLISMGQLYGHFDTIIDAVDKLDNSDFPTVNAVRNKGLSLTGSDKATNVKAAAKAVAAEVARVFKVAGVVGEKETKEWESLIDPSMSPEQLKGTVKTLVNLVDSRVQEQGARWNAQFPDHPRRLYSPSAEKKLEQVRTWTESSPEAAPRRQGSAPAQLPPGVKSIQVVE